MAYEFIRVDREGPITIFTLNRPEVMNALHSPAHFELDDAFNAFADTMLAGDPVVRRYETRFVKKRRKYTTALPL